MIDPTHLIRPDFHRMDPYTAILPFEILSRQLGIPPEQLIKLDANENPYGPSPRAVEALTRYPYLHIYPDPESRDLRAALATYTGVNADYLLAGSGADELIDLIMRLFITPGDAIINCPPTFGMYPFDAVINNAQLITVPRYPDFSLNLPAIHAAVSQNPRTKLLIIASPNNPDGSLLPEADLQSLLALPLVVILDEAYAEFSHTSHINWVPQYPNLIVLRTFSKWAGLAGLRVGYGAFPLPLITHLWKIKQPYNVNIAAQIMAIASLEDADTLQHNLARIIATRDQFQHDLTRITWLKAYPSQANFVLTKVIGKNAPHVKQRLAQRGILIRYYHSPGLQDHLRFSIGTSEQMKYLLSILEVL